MGRRGFQRRAAALRSMLKVRSEGCLADRAKLGQSRYRVRGVPGGAHVRFYLNSAAWISGVVGTCTTPYVSPVPAFQSEDDTLEKLAMRIQSRAVSRCGELLKSLGRPEHSGRPTQNGVGTDTISQRQMVKDAGLSKRQQVTAVRVANLTFTASLLLYTSRSISGRQGHTR
jgi:hypothetical protein